MACTPCAERAKRNNGRIVPANPNKAKPTGRNMVDDLGRQHNGNLRYTGR